ncbi:MAG: UMP kinase [bacterium]|nr:UMP kinase [bacterium]
MQKKPYIIIALGGSLIVKDDVRIDFLKPFRALIEKLIGQGHRFVIVAGGGKITRRYQKAAAHIVRVPNEDLDWLGIHATRLNAHLLRTIFWNRAYPVVVDDLKKPIHGRPNLLIAGGTRPGWSTDYVSVMLARRFGSKRVIVAGTYDAVYDKDFEKYPNAKRLPHLDWKSYRALIGNHWKPGLRAPVDPIAAKAAQRHRMRIDIVRAEDFTNFKRCIGGRPFRGSIID